MKDLQQLKKNFKFNFSLLPKIKIAILGDTATQLLVQAIRGVGYEYQFDLEIWEADFNQVERQVFDDTSELYEYKPDIIIIFHSTHKLLTKYNKLNQQERNGLAQGRMDLIEQITSKIKDQLKSKIIYYNYSETDDAIFGNYAESR